MNAARIIDPALPGLEITSDEARFLPALAAALKAEAMPAGLPSSMRIVRMRYRPGQRAIVQVEFAFADPLVKTLPASIWLFAGNKARKLAAGAAPGKPVFEPLSGSLVYLFPNDPHVPEIARFMANAPVHAETLAPGSSSAPELARFRPGLGATFRWALSGGGAVYVKIQKDKDAREAFKTARRLMDSAAGNTFSVPEPRGLDSRINAFAMDEVRGSIFGDVLAQAPARQIEDYVGRLLTAMGEFHASGIACDQHKDRGHFAARAQAAADLVGIMDPARAVEAQSLAAAIAAAPVTLAAAPAHCDMKVEHIVYADGKFVLLDLDSFALADPLYDFAMLDIRTAMMAESGACSADAAALAGALIRAGAGSQGGPDAKSRYGWLKSCAALQLAKHHTQNLSPDSSRLAAAALAIGQNAYAAGGFQRHATALGSALSTQDSRLEIPSCA